MTNVNACARILNSFYSPLGSGSDQPASDCKSTRTPTPIVEDTAILRR